MNITKKTYYMFGVVSAALNLLGGAALLLGTRLSLLFNLATIAAGAMMLLLATCAQDGKLRRNTSLAGALLTILGMVPGAVGAVCGAASWPVFVWPYFKAASPDAPVRKAASVVFVCGGVLLAGSFVPVPRMLGGCLICAVAVAQGLFAFLLYQKEKEGGAPQ